jgi:hypothetical protein
MTHWLPPGEILSQERSQTLTHRNREMADGWLVCHATELWAICYGTYTFPLHRQQQAPPTLILSLQTHGTEHSPETSVHLYTLQNSEERVVFLISCTVSTG